MDTPNGTVATVTTMHRVWGSTVIQRFALVPAADDWDDTPIVYARTLKVTPSDGSTPESDWVRFGRAHLIPGIPLADALFAYVYYAAFPDSLTRVDEVTWGTWCPDHKEDIIVNEDDKVFIAFICHECGRDVSDDEAVHVLNRPFHVECAPEEDEDDVTSDPAWHPACPECQSRKESN